MYVITVSEVVYILVVCVQDYMFLLYVFIVVCYNRSIICD